VYSFDRSRSQPSQGGASPAPSSSRSSERATRRGIRLAGRSTQGQGPRARTRRSRERRAHRVSRRPARFAAAGGDPGARRQVAAKVVRIDGVIWRRSGIAWVSDVAPPRRGSAVPNAPRAPWGQAAAFGCHSRCRSQQNRPPAKQIPSADSRSFPLTTASAGRVHWPSFPHRDTRGRPARAEMDRRVWGGNCGPREASDPGGHSGAVAARIDHFERWIFHQQAFCSSRPSRRRALPGRSAGGRLWA